ncbi:MAG: isoprenylcysteine carboxylmethyltransferase family protein, partial [Pseudomonadota bacterium]
MKRAAQPSSPGKPTTQLLQHDIFRYSRNPAYLGALVCFAGLSVLLDSLWLVAGATISILLLDRYFVRAEEEYLTSQFGDTYHQYRKVTRRWL